MTKASANGSDARGGVVNEEPTIDRVKELLFGQEQRQTDDKIEELKASLQAAEQRLDQKIEALRKDIEKMDRAQTQDLQQRLSSIGDAVSSLGKAVSSVAEPRQ